MMHTNSIELFKQYAIPMIQPGYPILEVGGIAGCRHYETALTEAGINLNWTVADLKNSSMGDWGSGSIEMLSENSIGSADSMFQYVLAGQVIEHVRRPWLWVAELARVCRPGGLVILLSPISWNHHRVPVDCWRIWPDGMRVLFEDAGLEPEFIHAEACGKDTPKELKCQINPGPVLDLISIGRKPGGPPR